MKFNIKKIAFVLGIIFILILIGFFINSSFFKGEGKLDFEINELSIKNVVVEGGGSSNQIDIINLKSRPNTVYLSLMGIPEFVTLKDEKLDFESREEISTEIFINPGNNSAGVYVGEFLASSNDGGKMVPVILEIQTPEFFFKPDVLLFSDNLLPGQILNVEIDIFDLNGLGKKDIEVDYFVKNFRGDIIVSENENLSIIGKQSFTKSVNMPSDLDSESYVFIAIVNHNGSISTSSSTFSIAEKGGQSLIDSNLVYITLVFLFFFIAFLVLFFYSMFSRDKILDELKMQYNCEIRRQRERIGGQRSAGLKKLDTRLEKKEYEKEFKKIESKRLTALRNIQSARVSVYKKIKRGSGKERGKGKEKELKKQLSKWKSQGYNTKVLEKKYKAPSANSIKKKIREYAAKGYDTSVLSKHLKK